MGFMLSMIFSPLIRSPFLEITAEMAQPDGFRNSPSNGRMWINPFLPDDKNNKKKNKGALFQRAPLLLRQGYYNNTGLSIKGPYKKNRRGGCVFLQIDC